MPSATPTPVVVKPKAITKQQMITAPSIVHWRELYAPLVPAFRERLAAATTTTTNDHDNDPSSSSNAGNANANTTATAGPDDDEVCRFLAEWAGDVPTAVGHYLDAQAWRRATFPIPRAEVLPTLKTQKLIFHGFDRAGRPVCYYRTRLHDPRAFAPEATVRAVVYLYEELQALARRPGFAGVREEVCVVVDRTDGRPSNFDVEFVKLFISTFKKVYPARLECFLVYPSNWLFNGIWALVKPFLDAKSRGSAFLLQSKTELLDFIAEDQLASFLGGGLVYESTPLEGEEEDGQEMKEGEAAMTA